MLVILIFIIVAGIGFLIWLLNEDKEKTADFNSRGVGRVRYPLSNSLYTAKHSFLSVNFKRTLNILKFYLPDYTVIPKVPLSAIIDKQGDGYQNELNRIVNYGVFTRDYRPLLLIEKFDNDRERNGKIDMVCQVAGIKTIKIDESNLGQQFGSWLLSEAQNAENTLFNSTDRLYKVKNSLVTKTEKLYMEQIIKAAPPSYHIIPQVSLNVIISKKGYHKYANELYRIADFGIFDENYNLKALVEINDPTHYQQKRIERDETVANICKQARIPLLVYKTDEEGSLERCFREVGRFCD